MRKSTNTVIQQQDKKGDKVVYYIPAYIRLKLKNFLDVNIESLNAEVLATLNISIGIKHFKQYVVSTASKARYQHLYNALKTGLLVKFSKDQSMKLSPDIQNLNVKFKQSDDQFSFTIWKVFNMNIMAQKYWLSPFQLLNLRLSLSLDYIKTHYEGIEFIFKFNCMDLYKNLQLNYPPQHLTFVKLSYVGDFVSFGQYTMAKAKMATIYSCNKLNQASKIKKQQQILKGDNPQQQYRYYFGQNYQRKPQDESNRDQRRRNNAGEQSLQSLNQSGRVQAGESGNNFMRIFGDGEMNAPQENPNRQKLKFKSWQYAHFMIPLFRTPVIDLLTIFLPLWLLGFINLLIFFQDNNFGDRLANITGVMIAFSALIPTIRSQIPPAPQITLVQVMIYLEIGTSLLALIQSYIVLQAQDSTNSEGYLSQPGDWKNDYFFIAAVTINILTITVILSLFMVFFIFWRKSYLNVNTDIDEEIFKQIEKSAWKGRKCDTIFMKYMSDNRATKQFKFLNEEVQNEQNQH